MEEELALFTDILKFPTVSGLGPQNQSYSQCSHWILSKCIEIGLHASILQESVENKPVIVAEWKGSDESLPCILLNSHYDVVPINESYWTVPAFDGVIRDGKVYGRGTQDMKCVIAQYLTAIKRLSVSGFQPIRTIRLCFVPDEEIGGQDGMGILLSSKWFSETSIAIALDEGLASEDDDYSVFYGERLPWWVKVTATGNTGHASRFIEGTAMEQILGVANRALEFRQQQKNLLHDGQSSECNCNQAIAAKRSKRRSTLGDVTTVNLTMIKSSGCDSGAYNVIPTQVQAGFDIRISPNMSPPDMTLEINKWCQDAQNSAIEVPAGYGGVTWEYVNTSNCQTTHAVTSVSAAENPWWDVFQNCIQNECNTELTPLIFPAATDSRFLRALGIRAFGFSPIKRSPILLHEHDEYLSVENYFEGCDVYVKLIKSLSSQNRLATDM